MSGWNTDVLVVGGGFSGVALAANLARSGSNVRVTISRKPDGPAFGIAYQTDCPLHLLNVPARGMSAIRDVPTHFVDWSIARGRALAPLDFAPRNLYRQYLEQLLAGSIEGGQVCIDDIETIAAIPIEGGWRCTMADGRTIYSRSVVLAFGSFAPSLISEMAHVVGNPAFVANPWTGVDRVSLDGVENIGIIGSGLTAVDVVLGFEARGYQGRYTMLSRRGLLPLTHDLHTSPFPLEELPGPSPDIRSLLRGLREAAEKAASMGTNWRGVIDAMRPNSAKYWQTLTLADKQRFLRHARAFWEVHRHRLAPEIATRIARLRSDGSLTVLAGRLRAARADFKRISVPFIRNGESEADEHRFDLLFNCTGPAHRVTSWASPLIQGLLESGVATTDPFDRGINSDEHGQVQPGLFLLGHARRGQLWESTAVPELRSQAAALSEHLTAVTLVDGRNRPLMDPSH